MRWPQPPREQKPPPIVNAWHLWWAWRPIYCRDTFQWVWRETVWRYVLVRHYAQDLDHQVFYRLTEPREITKP